MPATFPIARATATILIVEDDPGIAELERTRLEEVGHTAIVAGNSEDALREVGRRGVDLVLLDYRLPDGVDGLEFYARVKAAGYDLPVILVTGFGNEATVIQAMRVGVRDFVTKSLEYMDYLPEAVDRVLRQVGTERRLAESEARLAGIIGSAKDAVIVVEADRRVSLFNPAAEQMFGCPTALAIGRPITSFIPDELESGAAGDSDSGSLTIRLRTGTSGVRASGEVFPLEATVSPVRSGGRKFYTLVVRDITERRRAQEKLRASEERFRLLVEGVRDYALIMLDSIGHILTWNAGAERISGYAAEEILGRHFSLFYPPEDMASRRFDRELRTAVEEGLFEEEGWRVRKDGSRYWAWVVVTAVRNESGALQGFAKVTRDLTERRKLEVQFQQAQKMEAVGRLAGGVAHDFNNLLTIINGYSDLLMQKFSDQDPDRELVMQIRDAGERSASLTRQLLMFSRQQVVTPRVMDVNVLVTDAVKMLRRLVGEDVQLETALRAKGLIRADSGLMEQVLMNLVVNARDAMPHGGRLTVETVDTRIRPGDNGEQAAVAAGDYVVLLVSDTGCGMPPEVKARLFEPFFTTKDVGKGTGLGLAVIHGVVKQAGGYVEVYSEVGVGTSFKVYLPSIDEPVRLAKAEVQVKSAPRGTETVLLVEDEDAVRALTRYVLTGSGYRVLEAGDGDSALRIARAQTAPIHLLVSDVVMPGLGGPKLAEQITSIHPETRVLFLSGYTDDAVIRYGILHEKVHFVQKPFSPQALIRKVREVLDGARW